MVGIKTKYCLVVFLCCFYATNAFSQDRSVSTLKDLLQEAEKNYPLLKAKLLDAEAAKKAIDISKSTLLPSLDASYQADYATYNNITGMLYPQFIIPMTGPVASSNNMTGTFGSATSILLNWQPITFGQRQAQIDYSKTGSEFATADATNEIFKHKIRVINTYLDVLNAEEIVKVYEENLKRTEVNLSQAKVLVINGIKPGVDSTLLKSEVSRAKVDLLNIRKQKDLALIILSQLLAANTPPIVDDSIYFKSLPNLIATSDSIQNPLLSLYNSSIELNKAKRKTLSKTTLPSLSIWSTAYARGSGVHYDATVKSADGFGLQRYNYGVGFQLSMPILQFARIKPQLQQQDYLISSNTEKLNEITLHLKKENELADTTINRALAIANESPLFYESAVFSYNALLSRYQSGLANFADLIQAQYALVKAETDNRTAYMSVWKALLYKAAVNGDLNLFLNQVK